MAERALQRLSGGLGRGILRRFNRPLQILAFGWVCLKVMARRRLGGWRVLGRILVEQIYFTGVQSAGLIMLVALLVGAVVVIQGYTQLSRVGGQEALASLLIVVIIRELGPLLTAVVVILRSGSAIAIEMGYMRVLGEIESLQMLGIHPLHYLAPPRLLGVSLAVFCLFVLFTVVSILGGIMAASAMTSASLWSLSHELARNLSGVDLVVALAKVVSFGLAIPLVCMYQGLGATRAMTTIPPLVSLALVECFVYCFMANLVISAMFYL